MSALVLLDLTATLDAADHLILMDVLSSRFGVHDYVYERFHYYLSSQTQIFCTPSDTSNVVVLTCSMPQDLVVGTLLFITYTEDVEDLIETFSVKDHLCADNTKLLAHI